MPRPACRQTMPPWLVAAFAVGGALLAWLAFHGSATNYDTQWSLTWARDLIEGRTPGYETPGAATPHPLTTALALLTHAAGYDAAADLQRVVIYGAAGGLLALTGALAQRLAGPLAAVLGVTALAFASPLAVATAVAFQDVLAGALVLLAVTLAVAAPRRAAPPLVVLAAAGLVRPEMWGLAACWWLTQLPGRSNGERARLALLAAIGPALWALTDLLATGDPFFSFNHTREGAAAAERVTGAENGPRVLYDNLRLIFGRWVLAAAFVGAAGLLWSGWRARRDSHGRGVLVVPVTSGLLLLAFLALAVGSVSLLARYLLPLAALLAVSFGVAAGGWLTAAVDSRLRVAWALAGVAVVLASVGFARDQLHLTRITLDSTRISGEAHADLARFRGTPAVADASARCGPLTATNARTATALAERLHRAPAAIVVRPLEQPPARPATLVLPATTRVRDAAELLGARAGALPSPPPGARLVARNRSWSVYALGC